MTARKIGGVSLTVAAVALALGGPNFLATGLAVDSRAVDPLGVLAAFAAAFCGALCSVLYRPYLERYPTLLVSTLAMLAAVAFLALLAAAEGFFLQWPAFDRPGWAAVLFIGLSSGAG